MTRADRHSAWLRHVISRVSSRAFVVAWAVTELDGRIDRAAIGEMVRLDPAQVSAGLDELLELGFVEPACVRLLAPSVSRTRTRAERGAA